MSRAPVRPRRGAGRVTLEAVAAAAGVSAITVSRFFNRPELLSAPARERIAAAVEQLGYVPNQVAGGLASARGRIVGMVVPNISGPIFAGTIQAFNETLDAHGYQSLLASSYFSLEAEERAVRAFLGWNPAGLVLTSRFHSVATEKLIAAARIPVIEAWEHAPERATAQVGFSHRQVGIDAVAHLLAQGHRRIAFVHNSVAGDYSAHERADGYAAAMAAAGLQAELFTPAPSAPFEAGRQAMQELMARAPRPQAIVFANDNLAAGGLLAGVRAGLRIPEECAVFGFGDYPFAEMLLPSLTTIRPPAREIGEHAARLVLEAAGALPAAQAPRPPVRLECRLVRRESA